MYDGLLGNFVDDCDSQGRKLQAVCRGDKPKLMTIQVRRPTCKNDSCDAKSL